MLLQVITGLTAEQKRACTKAGLSDQLRCDWRKGRRLPTEPQVWILASIAGVNRHDLQDAVALLRATPQQRTFLGNVGRAVTTTSALALAFAGSLATGGAPNAGNCGATGDRDNVYRVIGRGLRSMLPGRRPARAKPRMSTAGMAG